jgi:phenylacetate-CoA ligase
VLEAIIRRFEEVVEYRVRVDQTNALTAIRVELEPRPGVPADAVVERVGRAIRDELMFRVDVQAVAPGSLPRFEMKARRFVWVR